MIFGRAENDSLGLLNLFAQLENVSGIPAFVLLPVAEDQGVAPKVDQLGLGAGFFSATQRDPHRRSCEACGPQAPADAYNAQSPFGRLGFAHSVSSMRAPGLEGPSALLFLNLRG